MRNLWLASALLFTACASTSTVTPTPAVSPTQQTNDDFVKQILESIKGRETRPASEVFKNIQILKNVEAARFLRIMNGGYSKALGVACTHCHVSSDFASDDKRPKRAAREMAVMHRSINDQLRAMHELQTEPSARPISCITCHRGEAIPNRG